MATIFVTRLANSRLRLWVAVHAAALAYGSAFLLCPVSIELTERKAVVGLALAVVIIVTNIAISPVNTAGERRPWGYSGESWHPYLACFRDLRDAGVTRVLLANHGTGYARQVPTSYLEWEAEIRQIKPLADADFPTNLAAAIAFAERPHFPVVVYRCTLDGSPPDDLPRGWSTVARYPSRCGELAVLMRLTI